MTGAFGGDAGVKAALLARLRHHADTGRLRFGATHWTGEAGSPLGVSVEGGDSADYAARFGYPLALAGLLDPMTALAAPDEAVEHTMRWVSCVEPGADLTPVPQRIAEHLLLALAADGPAVPYLAKLRALYAAEAGSAPPPRRAWTALRQAMEQAAEAMRAGGDDQAALAACAIACWPLRTSRSVLSTLVMRWVQEAARMADPIFGEADHRAAMAMLAAIHAETEAQRESGVSVDIPSIFRARAPTLAAGFEARLDRANARYEARAHSVPAMVLAHLAG